MEKNIRENVGFYAMGIIAIIIAVLGITANTMYTHTGGYALGAGCVAVAFLFECFIFAVSPKIAKTRTKGVLFFTAVILTIYTILFIFGDLAHIKAYKYLYVNGEYVSKLRPLGVFALVFEVICLILTMLLVARMVFNLFGKEFKLYEKILGTTVIRYKERDNVEIDLPPKDTEKLVASAKRALSHDEKLEKAIEAPEESKTPKLENKTNTVPVKKDNKQTVANTVNSNSAVSKKQNITVANGPDRGTYSKNFSSGQANTKQTKENTTANNNSTSENLKSYSEVEEDETLIMAERLFMGESIVYSDTAEGDEPQNSSIYNDSDSADYAEFVTPEVNSDEDSFYKADEGNSEQYENSEIIATGELIQENVSELGELSVAEVDNSNEDYEEYHSNEVYADTSDVGGVLADNDIREDVRNSVIIHHITEQVDKEEDDIYSFFDYDSDNDNQ